MPDTSPAAADTAIARLVVAHGFATAQEVDDCRKLHKALADADEPRTLAELLVSNGVVTQSQIDRLLSQSAPQNHRHQIPGYQLLEKLGAGAMAAVFKARQLSLDRIVAIKVLPSEHVTDPNFVERFYGEGRAAAKLNHPNIVQAIDVGQAGDFHYFVMEYIEGHTVADHLEKHGRYGEKEALRIVIQVAEALAHAHSKGLIHRDVKPKNIMITNTGLVKLADMGLARMVTDREAAEAEAGRAYGTPYYIAPEQIRGEVNVDFRCDIYGLGATFYLMLTGRVPFDAPTPAGVMHKHLIEDLKPPDHVNPDLTAGVSEVIETMMAKDPDHRYATTVALLEDLKAVAAGEPPMQARKAFNVATLAALEEGEETVDYQPIYAPVAPLWQQPLFWIAVASGAINILLLVMLFSGGRG